MPAPISFSCPHCGMKFQVKTQFAGRPSHWPTCKQSLVVPQPSRRKPTSPRDLSTARPAASIRRALIPAYLALPESAGLTPCGACQGAKSRLLSCVGLLTAQPNEVQARQVWYAARLEGPAGSLTCWRMVAHPTPALASSF
jgi:hypothetical protein